MYVLVFSLFLSILIFTELVSAKAYADIPPTITLDKVIYPVPFGQLYNPVLPVGFTGDFLQPKSTVTSQKGLFPYHRDVTGNGLTVNPQNTLSNGDVMVHIRVNDQDYNTSTDGTDVLAVGVNDVNHGPVAIQITRQDNSMLLTYAGGPQVLPGKILNLNGTAIPTTNSSTVAPAIDLGPMTEIAPDYGIFQADLPIRMTDGPQNVDCPTPQFWAPTDGTTGKFESDRFHTVHFTTSNPFGGNYCVRQGDVLTVTYTFVNKTSGHIESISESSTFDLRNGTISTDKSRYNIGSDMIITLIEPDLNHDSQIAETIPLDMVEWDSYSFKGTIGQLGGQGLAFDAKPGSFIETGKDTDIFQTVIKIPKKLNNNLLLEDGEKINLEYTDWGPAGPIVGKNYHNADAIIYTTESNGTIHWTGNGDASHWSDPNNWSTLSLPTGKDYVVIDGNNKTSSLVHLDVNFTLDSGGRLVIQPGDTLVVDAGKMISNNPLTGNDSSTLSVEGTLDNNGLIVIKGSHQNVFARMLNEGLVNNNVGAMISITGGDAYIFNNGKMINNNMIKIHVNSSDVGTFFALLQNTDEFVNNGKIQFDNTIFANNNVFSNFGSVVINSGTFQSFGTFTNNPGALFLDVNSSSNTGSSYLIGSMNNSGNFTLAGNGTFNIYRSGFFSNTGTLNNEINNTIDNMGIINNLCGGIINNDGTILDNPVNQIPCPVVTLYSNKDSTIIQSANTTNFGSNGTVLVSQVGHKRTLVSFDLSPYETRQVSDATLRLYLTTATNSNNKVFHLHRLLSDWTEGNGTSKTNRGTGSGVTWDCSVDSNIANAKNDCTIPWNGGKYGGITDSKVIKNYMIHRWIEFNVTKDVNSFLDGNPNDNYGWIIKKSNETNSGLVGFVSKENADSSHIPQLVLTFK